jgi:hypothetical protein
MSEHLRALALAATPGPWHWDSDEVKNDPIGRTRYQVVCLGQTITRMYQSSFEGGPTKAEADAAFIAAANPAAILGLLDELADHERAYALLFKENAELRKDANRYRWLRAYLISDSTEHDDAIVASASELELDEVIDSAAKGESNA